MKEAGLVPALLFSLERVAHFLLSALLSAAMTNAVAGWEPV
jgi:hypothetical protein